jgi:hypothetical protein
LTQAICYMLRSSLEPEVTTHRPRTLLPRQRHYPSYDGRLTRTVC